MADVHHFLPKAFPVTTRPSTPQSESAIATLWYDTMDDSDEYVEKYYNGCEVTVLLTFHHL